MNDIYALLPDLFALSDEEKEQCSMRNSPAFLGYTKLGAESTAKATDLREVFPGNIVCLEETWHLI